MSVGPIHRAVYALRDADGFLLSLQDPYRAFNNWAVPIREDNDVNYFKQLFMVEYVENTNPYQYTLRCLTNAALLTAEPQSKYPEGTGNFVSGFHQSANNDTQRWTFENINGRFIIRNVQLGTVLETHSAYNNAWGGVNNAQDGRTQYWSLERRSRSSSEVEALVRQHPMVRDGNAFSHYAADGSYIILPDSVRQEIWDKSMMGKKNGFDRVYTWRSEIFDCDDFSINMKAEVAKWAANTLKADHVSIQIGICWGDSPTGAHAFNWFLTQDLAGVTFYEPQAGTTDDNALGYSIYFGHY